MKPLRPLAPLLLLTALALAYVVKDGETLWTISETQFSDPFRWSEIWEVNPHLTNPHLLHAGDSLVFPGPTAREIGASAQPGDTMSVASTAPNPEPRPQQPTAAGNDFRARIGNMQEREGFEAPPSTAPTATYLGGGGDSLPRTLNRFLQALAPHLTIPNSSQRTFAKEWFLDFEDNIHGIVLKENDLAIMGAGSDLGVKKGDLLEVFAVDAERISLPHKDTTLAFAPYQILGYARVVHVAKSKSRVKILRIYDKIIPVESRVRPAELPPFLKVRSYEKITEYRRTDMAEVVHSYKAGLLNQNYSWVSVNRGVDRGFQPGNAVAIWESGYEKTKGLPPRLLATGLVVWADANTSTVMIRELLLPSRNPSSKDKVSVTWRAIAAPDAP